MRFGGINAAHRIVIAKRRKHADLARLRLRMNKIDQLLKKLVHMDRRGAQFNPPRKLQKIIERLAQPVGLLGAALTRCWRAALRAGEPR